MSSPLFRVALATTWSFALATGCTSQRASVSAPVRPAQVMLVPGQPPALEETYRGCPPTGRGNEDPFINQMKNRIDRPLHPSSFSFTQIENLDWPAGVTDVPTAHWPAAARRLIFRHDGMPVSFTGFISGANHSGPEPANCSRPDGFDWHMWLGSQPHAPHPFSFLAEITPRIRARETGFSLQRLNTLAAHGVEVRITGWMIFDSEHPEQSRQRATIWEIHPVTAVDAWQSGRWQRVAG